MLPSRGFRWSGQTIGIGRRRLEVSLTRNFASSSRQYGSNRAGQALSKAHPLLSTANPSFQISRSNPLMRNGTGLRFASTTPALPGTAAPVVPPAPAAPVTSEAFADANPATTPLDLDTTLDSLLNAPERLGYLQSLGLDFGWGPTTTMEWVLEHIHVLAGTPWWASIALTAILVRAALFRSYVSASETSTRTATIMPITKPIRDKMTAALREGGQQETVMRLRSELQIINKRAGINPWKLFIPPFVQAAAGFGTFRLLNAMSKLPVPGLETGGVLWFHNLTISDPFYLLPLSTAALLHILLKRGGEMGVSTLTPGMLTAMKWGLPGLTLTLTSWLPAAVQLTFLVSGALSFGQATLLRQSWFRSFFNMTPVPTATKPAAYQGTIRKAAPAASPVLSQSQLSARFQGAVPPPSRPAGTPTTTSTPPPADGETKQQQNLVAKIFSGAVQDIKSTTRTMRESAASVMGKGKREMGQRLAKRELQDRKKYERQRQDELRREKWEQENDRRAERAQRRIEKHGR